MASTGNPFSIYILGGRALRALLIVAIWTKAVGGVPDGECSAIRKALRDLLFFGLIEGKVTHEGSVWVTTQKGESYLEENIE